MFANMKIGVRLSLGFGLVILMLVAVVYVGTSRMDQINKRMKEIVSINNVELKLATDMRDQSRQAAAFVRNIIILTDDAGMRAQKDALDAAQAKYDDFERKLDKMFNDISSTTAKEKELMARAKEAKRIALASQSKVVELGLANKNEEATKLLLKEAAPDRAKWLDVLNELTDFEVALNDEAAVSSEKEYQAAQNLMLSVSAIAILMGLFAAFLITRSVTRPLGNAMEVANRLAEGDLTQVLEVKSKDETGQLLQSMKNMIGKLSQVVSEVNSSAHALAGASEEVSATAQSLSQ